MTKFEMEKLEKVSISKIWVNPKLVFRKWFEKQKFEQLRESVRAKGIIEPVIVRSNQGESELVLGLLRYLAAKEVGIRDIPAIYRDISDQDVLLLRLVGNNQQELNPFDEALYIVKLINEFKLKIKDITKEIGKGERVVNERIKLLNLCEEIQKMVFEGALSLEIANHLVDLPIEKQKEWANLAIEHNLSVVELCTLIKKEDVSHPGEKRDYVRSMTGMKINLRLKSLIPYLDKIEKAVLNLERDDLDDLLAIKESTELLVKKVAEIQKQIQNKIRAKRAA